MSKLFKVNRLFGKQFLASILRSSQLVPKSVLLFEIVQNQKAPSNELEKRLSHENGLKQTSITFFLSIFKLNYFNSNLKLKDLYLAEDNCDTLLMDSFDFLHHK